MLQAKMLGEIYFLHFGIISTVWVLELFSLSKNIDGDVWSYYFPASNAF